MATVRSPESIPALSRVSVPKQSRKDLLVTSLAALFDRSLMRTVTFVVEKRVLPRDVDLDMLRDSIHAMLDTNLVDKPDRFFQLRSGAGISGSARFTGKASIPGAASHHGGQDLPP